VQEPLLLLLKLPELAAAGQNGWLENLRNERKLNKEEWPGPEPEAGQIRLRLLVLCLRSLFLRLTQSFRRGESQAPEAFHGLVNDLPL
jgi:hypothetical protein